MTDNAGESAGHNKSTWMSFLKSIATFTGDLSTLTAPSFILSGTSLLEYSAYWADYPELLAGVKDEVSPEQRMVAVCKWYLSTLKGQFSARHASVGAEKKPLNPVLGEEFHGYWTGSGGDREERVATLTAEQVSHHPPISAYLIRTHNGITLEGHNGQKSGFSGRTIQVKQVGFSVLSVPLSDGSLERYLITFPQLTLEGLFYGAPYAELADRSYISSTSGWVAENEYTGKGWVSGKKNSVKTRVYSPQSFAPDTPSSAADKSAKWIIDGVWTDELRIRPASTPNTQPSQDFLNFRSMQPATFTPTQARDQAYDSRRLWGGVSAALKAGEFDVASKLKSGIEQSQRDLRKQEKAEGSVWKRKFFIWTEGDRVPEVVIALAARVNRPCEGWWHAADLKQPPQLQPTKTDTSKDDNINDEDSDGDEFHDAA
ncbi:Oxysterol-binding protein 4 [Savitreella phatthalungensis]